VRQTLELKRIQAEVLPAVSALKQVREGGDGRDRPVRRHRLADLLLVPTLAAWAIVARNHP
jgi:hypothetical protein